MTASVLSPPTTSVSSHSTDSIVDSIKTNPKEKLYTISDLIRTRANANTAHEPIVAYPSSGTDYVYYTPYQLDTLVEAAAVHYAKFIPQRRSSADPVQVVGLLVPSDFEYLITLAAISRLGHTVVLLSTRISEDAYVSLMESTNASLIITYSSFNAMGEKVTGRTGARQIPVISPLDPSSSEVCNARLPLADLDGPTENQFSHAGALRNYANNFSLKGFITLPLFHAHGISCLFRAVHSERLIYLYNASLPLTATALLTTLKEHPEIQVLYAVPYALKLLSETEEGLRCMAPLELVMFGGSSCPKPIGDVLVQNGVRLVSHYGTTETGQLMSSFRDRSDLDWDYVRPGPALLSYIRWKEQPGMPGVYELSVLEGWPSKVASNRPDNSYATKDLFEKHPTTPKAWRCCARLDDTLVLENGEKANPLAIEGVARKNPNVGEAVAFGSGKPCLGLFVIPSDECPFKSDDELIDAIFPISRRATRNLLHKGTVTRSAFYKEFAERIAHVYDDADGEGDLVLEDADLIKFLREKLLDIAPSIDPSALHDETDIFSLGIDSLQSTRLRSAIMSNLDLNGKKLSQNFVFENPSLQDMADQTTNTCLGKGPKLQAPVEGRMEKLIEKYSSNFKTHEPVQRDTNGQYVVLTGATGSLGAHIAAQLAQVDNVRKMYCFVRADSKISARKRVIESLRTRAVYTTLSPASEQKIVALPADLSNSDSFGLDEDTFSRVRKTVTHVIHCAWSVNFNWALKSFETSCISATRNLLDLCLSAQSPHPASFSFCSSVSTVARTPGSWVLEALPESLSYAQGMGYAQSKLVTEKIVSRAAGQTGITARVLRVGQTIGDTVNGIWNATEAIPMIIQTAKTIKALPQLNEVLFWTPVGTMASSIIELSLSTDAAGIMNVTNPTFNHWTHGLLLLLRNSGLEYEVLPKKAWLHRLRDSNQDPELNPPIKLLEFFTSKYDNYNPSSVLLYDTKLARAGSSTLANAGSLTEDLTSRFMRYFETQCWNKNSSTPTSLSRNVFFLIGPYSKIEGDNFHSPLARQKMSNNLPLVDSDRWNWLPHIRGAVMDRLLNSNASAIAVTCSALCTCYRDELRRLSHLFDFPVTVTFILLSMKDREGLKERSTIRAANEQHYMKSGMVDSQLDLLEAPTDESDVTIVDASQPKERMLDDVFGIFHAIRA
ncbi:hypothetical protein N7488_008867 [Penicillium malachiteum]|nr:hypothetical protein N7488_008867 [Penicillium malachiteum]